VMRHKQAVGATFIKSYKQPTRRQRQQLIKAGREAGIMVDVEGEEHFYNNIDMIIDGHANLEHSLPVANYYDDVIQLFAHSSTSKPHRPWSWRSASSSARTIYTRRRAPGMTPR